MSGIIGIFDNSIIEYDALHSQLANQVVDGLLSVQHRGQYSVGIADEHMIYKKRGLVRDTFIDDNILSAFTGRSCIGIVQYSTTRSYNDIQPLYTNFPRRISICHNGNIINLDEVRDILKNTYHMIFPTTSDSEVLLALYSCKLHELLQTQEKINEIVIEKLSQYLQDILHGSFCILLTIHDYGFVVIRDKRGIRPLIWGKKDETHIFASESVAMNVLDYDIVRDIYPGETILFTLQHNNTPRHFFTTTSILSPCLYEYIYIARVDSVIDNLSVLDARVQIGKLLGEKMMKRWGGRCNMIDYIIPVSDTCSAFANGIQTVINKPIKQGLVKNQYIDRTSIIMQKEKVIDKQVKQKICGIQHVFQDKTVLILDDSIIRGNTSKHIIHIARKFGCKKIFFASCSPMIIETNQYGIFIPTKEELISFERTEHEIAKELNVEFLIYNDLDSIVKELKRMNSNIKDFEVSMFSS
jgi:amidophosphoribosyltransferase